MTKLLDSTSLSHLVESFKNDIETTDPLYFGKLELNSPDECDSTNMVISSKCSTSREDLANVTIYITCNDDADVTLTCITSYDS